LFAEQNLEVALRVHAATPQKLRDHLVIGYFV
jgi:hypothetical protein